MSDFRIKTGETQRSQTWDTGKKPEYLKTADRVSKVTIGSHREITRHEAEDTQEYAMKKLQGRKLTLGVESKEVIDTDSVAKPTISAAPAA